MYELDDFDFSWNIIHVEMTNSIKISDSKLKIIKYFLLNDTRSEKYRAN